MSFEKIYIIFLVKNIKQYFNFLEEILDFKIMQYFNFLEEILDFKIMQYFNF